MGQTPQGTEEEGGYKSPSITYLWAHHKQMAQMLVFGGATPGRIAAVTGFTTGQISRILGSPLFQAEVDRLMSKLDQGALADVREFMMSLGYKSAENLARIVNAPEDDPQVNMRLKKETSIAVLESIGVMGNKLGVSPVHLHKHQEIHLHEMSTAELQEDILNIIESD